MRRLDGCRMGIRYYGYAFDAGRTDEALADPRAFIASDPLADAWGFEPHAQLAVPTFRQTTPDRDLLYLDKAWRELQVLTEPVRPAYRMFEGQVTMSSDYYSWSPWVRALSPAEIRPIAEDLSTITSSAVRARLRRDGGTDDEADYVVQYLEAARRFVRGLARDGRGMAYLIG
jgi:hypothetical protein